MPRNKKVRNISEWRQEDKSFRWLEEQYPQLAEWRYLAVKWIKEQTVGVRSKLPALSAFFESYLVENGLPLRPAEFLARRLVLPDRKGLPDFYETLCPQSEAGVQKNNHVHDFLEFVLSQDDFTEADADGGRVKSSSLWNPVRYISRGKKVRGRAKAGTLKADKTLGWLKEQHPQLADWRELALNWIDDQSTALAAKLLALSVFFESYLIKYGLPLKPAELLARLLVLPDGKGLPNFYKTTCLETEYGIRVNNHIHDFLEFVLRAC